MYLKDRDPDNPTFCPLMRQPCMERKCEWWYEANPVWFSCCVLWHIANNIKAILFND